MLMSNFEISIQSLTEMKNTKPLSLLYYTNEVKLPTTRKMNSGLMTCIERENELVITVQAECLVNLPSAAAYIFPTD
jgi:hypothetical protein